LRIVFGKDPLSLVAKHKGCLYLDMNTFQRNFNWWTYS